MAEVRHRMPQIEIVERSEDTIKFWLSNTTTSVANALRRIILAEVRYFVSCVDRLQQISNAGEKLSVLDIVSVLSEHCVKERAHRLFASAHTHALNALLLFEEKRRESM